MTKNKNIKKFRDLKKSNGKLISTCNYCLNLISLNKLCECHECKRFYLNSYEKKLKVNNVLVIKNKNELEKLLDKNRYCNGCVTKIRTNKYLCPNCLIKFCNDDVILFIER